MKKIRRRLIGGMTLLFLLIAMACPAYAALWSDEATSALIQKNLSEQKNKKSEAVTEETEQIETDDLKRGAVEDYHMHTKNGDFYVNINGADGVNSRIHIKAVFDSTNEKTSQNVKLTIENDSVNNHGVSFVKADGSSSKTFSTTTDKGSTTEIERAEKKNGVPVSGKNSAGETVYRELNYTVVPNIQFQYTKEAYTYATGSGTVTNGTSRMNDRKHDWTNTGASTLNGANGVYHSAHTETFSLQVNMGNMNVYKSPTTVAGKYTITLSHPTLDVTFKGNGATSGTSKTQSFDYNESKGLYTVGGKTLAFKKEGYKPASGKQWNTEKKGTGTSFTYASDGSKKYAATELVNFTDGEKFSKKTLTLYAQWASGTPDPEPDPVPEEKIWFVNYMPNGGTGEMKYGYASNYFPDYKIQSCLFTRDRYRFVGWNTESDGSGDTYESEKTYTLSGHLTLYAQWECTQYKIDYESNGGTGSMDSDLVSTVTPNYQVKSCLFTYDRYRCVSWNTEKDGSGDTYEAGQTYMLSGDLTLYAQWEYNKYYVCYLENGGTGSMGLDLPGSRNTDFVDKDSPNYQVRSCLFTRDKYRFVGWNTKSDGSGDTYEAGKTYTLSGNLSLYAQWEYHAYNIHYDANGGLGEMEDDAVSKDNPSYQVKVCDFYDRDLVFASWNTQADGKGTTYEVGKTYTLSGDLTLYAQWKEPESAFMLTLNKETGIKSVSGAGKYNAGDQVTIDAELEPGYRFTGWTYDIKVYGVTVKKLTMSESQTYTFSMPDHGYTLTANAEYIQYDIHYDANGGLGEMEDDSVGGENLSYQVKECDFYHRDLVFAGWNTQADGQGDTYEAGKTYELTEDLTLYAQWKKSEYTLTLKKDTGVKSVSGAGKYARDDQVTIDAELEPGYRFAGWVYEMNIYGTVRRQLISSKKLYTFSMPNRNYTLTASAEYNQYDIHYDANGGTGKMDDAHVSKDDPDYQVSGCSFTRPKYRFVNWNTSADGSGDTYEAGQTYKLTKDLTLYAQWKLNEYTLTLDKGTGITSVSGAGKYQPGAQVTAKAEVETGYHFTGWSNASGQIVSNDQSYTFSMPETDLTLTANAEANKYTIHFDPNGGAGHIDDMEAAYDTDVTLPDIWKADGTAAYVKYTLDGENVTSGVLSGTIPKGMVAGSGDEDSGEAGAEESDSKDGEKENGDSGKNAENGNGKDDPGSKDSRKKNPKDDAGNVDTSQNESANTDTSESVDQEQSGGSDTSESTGESESPDVAENSGESGDPDDAKDPETSKDTNGSKDSDASKDTNNSKDSETSRGMNDSKDSDESKDMETSKDSEILKDTNASKEAVTTGSTNGKTNVTDKNTDPESGNSAGNSTSNAADGADSNMDGTDDDADGAGSDDTDYDVENDGTGDDDTNDDDTDADDDTDVDDDTDADDDTDDDDADDDADGDDDTDDDDADDGADGADDTDADDDTDDDDADGTDDDGFKDEEEIEVEKAADSKNAGRKAGKNKEENLDISDIKDKRRAAAPRKKAYASVFMGWTLADGKNTFIPKWKTREVVKNLVEEDGGEVTLYAVWDDCPWIVAENLYYTLVQAQGGFITEAEILSHTTASDREDGSPIAPGTNQAASAPTLYTSYTIPDYQAKEFTDMQHDGSVTENLTVVDHIGNTYKKQITVHVVDTTPTVVTQMDLTGVTRFINSKYYSKAYEEGGLEDNSIWKVDPDYRAALEKALRNADNDTPIETYVLTKDTIKQMKAYVQAHGIGNSKEANALQNFYNLFLAPNKR